MEIISYVLEGALSHKDSMGNGSTIRPGDVQRMSAGTGVRHSEFNGSASETAHFLQIWIIPDAEGNAPGYEEKRFDDAEKRGRLRVIASPEGRDGAVKLGADAEVYAGLFDGDERAEFDVPAGRRVYVHVARGAISVNGEALVAGDAAKLEGVSKVTLEQGAGAEVILFDLALTGSRGLNGWGLGGHRRPKNRYWLVLPVSIGKTTKGRGSSFRGLLRCLCALYFPGGALMTPRCVSAGPTRNRLVSINYVGRRFCVERNVPCRQCEKSRSSVDWNGLSGARRLNRRPIPP
jgi:hypothetical protein